MFSALEKMFFVSPLSYQRSEYYLLGIFFSMIVILLSFQRELEKQQRIQHIAEQNTKAEEHYRQSLMKNYGLRPWKKLVQLSHQNMDVAIDHHSNVLLRECLLPWHQYTQEVKRGKCQVAEDQYQYMLVRRCFNSWKKVDTGGYY